MPRTIAIIIMACCLITACGQTGRLYLPDKQQQDNIQDNNQEKGG